MSEALTNASVGQWLTCAVLSHLSVTLCPFIQLGREAAFHVSSTVQTTVPLTSTCLLPNNPTRVDIVSLLVRDGELKLSKIMKQGQGHADLGSWEESPGLPRPEPVPFLPCLPAGCSPLFTLEQHNFCDDS